MALRRLLGCLPVAALMLCAPMGCKDKGGAAKPSSTLDQRCEQLGKACGDNDNHTKKIVEECKQAGKAQVEKGCTDKAIAVYDCYEKELCGKTDKVWSFDDLRVLADRKNTCAAARAAATACVGK